MQRYSNNYTLEPLLLSLSGVRGYALKKPYRRAFIGVSIGEDPG